MKNSKTMLISHIEVYFGVGGCLLKIPFTNLLISICSAKFATFSTVMQEASALLAAQMALYLPPWLYNLVKNSNTVFIDV